MSGALRTSSIAWHHGSCLEGRGYLTAATNALCSTPMHPSPMEVAQGGRPRESSTLFMGVLRRVASLGGTRVSFSSLSPTNMGSSRFIFLTRP